MRRCRSKRPVSISRASAAWSSCGTPRQERDFSVRMRVAEARRCEDPADAQGGRQGLADRSQRHHAVGGEALQRADRLPVVAELGVVVVLEDHPVDLVRPLHQLVATGRAQHRPGRALVGRRQQHGTGTAGAQVVDPDPLRVDAGPPTPAARPAARCGRGPAGPGPPARSARCRARRGRRARTSAPAGSRPRRPCPRGRRSRHAPAGGSRRARRAGGRRPRACRRRGRPSAALSWRRPAPTASRASGTHAGRGRRSRSRCAGTGTDPPRLLGRSGGHWCRRRRPAPSATRVPDPTAETTYPSASSCSYAETTRPRDTPSWSASCRVEGSRSPERSRPARIAVRRASWTCCPSGHLGGPVHRQRELRHDPGEVDGHAPTLARRASEWTTEGTADWTFAVDRSGPRLDPSRRPAQEDGT